MKYSWQLAVGSWQLSVRRIVTLLSLWTLVSFSLFAQTDRLTQADVELQQKFIEAKREMILEDYAKAIELFSQVLATDKTNAAAAYELARAHDMMSDSEKAVKYAKHAVENEPDNEWYQMFLGDLYQQENKDAEAAMVYGGLIEQDPDNDYFYFKQAYFLVRSNQPEEAIKVYENLEKRIGINEELTRRKHTLYLGIGNYKKAAKEIEELIEAFPHKIGYRHLLAGFYEQIGDNAKAN